MTQGPQTDVHVGETATHSLVRIDISQGSLGDKTRPFYVSARFDSLELAHAEGFTLSEALINLGARMQRRVLVPAGQIDVETVVAIVKAAAR